jgi:succinate dehydrogenase / fumarate reductase iron-sulfur subunit
MSTPVHVQDLQEAEVVFRVKRYSKEKGDYWQEYKLKVDRFTQVTEALRRIKVEQDPSLAYRASCHMAVCGSCGMKINGEPRLACKTLVLDVVKKFGTNVITLEPMDRFPIVKDLVVDMTEFYDRMERVKPRLYPSKEVLEYKAEHRLKPEDQRLLWKFAQCIWCGLCVSACPAVREDPLFLGPAAHAKGFRFLRDPRDTITDERVKVLADSAWRCTYCYMCYHVCPRDIEPVTAIKKTRALLKSVKPMGPAQEVGHKHSEAVYESIYTYGKINEGVVYVKTYGLIRSLIDMTYAFRAGKAKYALEKVEPVKEIEQVRELMRGE